MLCGRKLPHLYYISPIKTDANFIDAEQICTGIKIKTKQNTKIKDHASEAVHNDTGCIVGIQQQPIVDRKLYNLVDQQCNYERLQRLCMIVYTFCIF